LHADGLENLGLDSALQPFVGLVLAAENLSF